MPFPQDRLRRLRATAGFRRMVRETRLSVDNLIAPFLVVEGGDVRYDGWPRRGDPAGAGWRGLLPCADPRVCRQVCLLPVRAVPGGGGLQPEVWGPPVLSDGSSQPA